MIRASIIHRIIGNKLQNSRSLLTKERVGYGEALSNIALIKYWGKRDEVLNLPVTDSLSVSLPDVGAKTWIRACNEGFRVLLNDEDMPLDQSFTRRIVDFLKEFLVIMPEVKGFEVRTIMNIPHSAGLASSACGFAAIVLALNDFFGWALSVQELSILSRLGSGSACRSLFSGFVKWRAGVREDGFDSFAEPCSWRWPGLCLGLLIVSRDQKLYSSREAMKITKATSVLYQSWPLQVERDSVHLEQSIQVKDFEMFGRVIEQNALSMHATMLSAWPSIIYTLPETLHAIQVVGSLRQQGYPVFFTQDAGPNLKLFFQRENMSVIEQAFTLDRVIALF